MKNFLWVLWELPQIIVARIIPLFLREKRYEMFMFNQRLIKITYYRTNKTSAFAIGDRIFMPHSREARNLSNNRLRQHEYGHVAQSRIFGWSLAFIVGIPSFLRWHRRRIFNRSWEWYFKGWPENHADRLGGVVR